MSRRISLSRAARLAGVKRGALQQKIRAGELKTFEGEIDLADLLQTYPDAQIEDSSMLERVEQIMEQASFIMPGQISRRPDNAALTARVMKLSRELSRQRQLSEGYRQLLRDLVVRLRQLPDHSGELRDLGDWLDQAIAEIRETGQTIDQPLANEVFLRVMSAQASIIPSGHEFFIEGAESILEAGLRGGLALNYGCSNGNCGLCKMRVVSGETSRIKHHDYVLSEAEKGLGFVLGCSYTAVSDVVLEAAEAQSTADIPPQHIPVRVKRIEQPDDNILLLGVRTPRTSRLRFLAGQQARLSIDNIGASEYAIASCPCDDMNLQFHIEIRDADTLSRFLADSAKTNDLLTLEGPDGSFVLNENSANSLVFIAEGIGFATIKGLIEHAMALDVAQDVYLFWIADDAINQYLGNLCRAWNDALDNFHYFAIDAAEQNNFDQILNMRLEPENPQLLDYYLCCREPIRTRTARFAEARAVPEHQISYKAV